jgi:hypothetical protein
MSTATLDRSESTPLVPSEDQMAAQLQRIAGDNGTRRNGRRTGTVRLVGGAANLYRQAGIERLRRGSTRIKWDTDDPESLKTVSRLWERAASYGMLFYNETSGVDLYGSQSRAGFDPKTAPADLAIHAPMAGG